jgi:pimeloyl-ACP methyl ester carboxylesterase
MQNLLLLVCAALLTITAQASDILKEKRWADQLTDTLVVGEARYLTAQGHDFLAIYTEADSRNPQGGVILLHGIGAHPDWPEVIGPLRRELPTYGWATLSIQLPVLANDAGLAKYAPLFPESFPRIKAAIDFFHSQGVFNVVLIGHSLGAAMGAAYIANSNQNNAIKAFVGIGMGTYPQADINTLEWLQKITIPVLDLYGSVDLDSVTSSAQDRKNAAMKAGNSFYRQTKVLGADHFFNGLDDELISLVRSWLVKYSPGIKTGVQK